MFDTSDLTFLVDPYPALAELRADGQVHWHDGLSLFVAVSHAVATNCCEIALSGGSGTTTPVARIEVQA